MTQTDIKFSTVFYLIPLIIFISCKQSPDLTKDEVYQIMNEIIADDSLPLYTVCPEADQLHLEDKYEFSNQDEFFIERQKEIFKDFIFEPKHLNRFSDSKDDMAYVNIDTSCSAGIINLLSFPLISADRQKVVLKNTEDCHCKLGGYGGIQMYSKKNGHWKKVKSFDKWISHKSNLDLEKQIALLLK